MASHMDERVIHNVIDVLLLKFKKNNKLFFGKFSLCFCNKSFLGGLPLFYFSISAYLPTLT